MGPFSRETPDAATYEALHTTWRAAKKDLDAARSRQRHSTNPAVNAGRASEQQAVREEIRQAKEAEQSARKALRFHWDNHS